MQQHNGQRDDGVQSVQPWIGLAALFMGIVLLALLPLRWWILCFLVIGLMAGVAARCIDVHRTRTQIRRFVGSSWRIRDVPLGKQNEAKFTVLLRPSELANKVWIDVPRKSNNWYSQLPLEEVVLRAFETRDHQLICINEECKNPDADTPLVDPETWKDATRPLLDHSTCIVVLPGATQDSLREAQYLKAEGMIGKCIFVMPRSKIVPFERYARYWSGVRAAYRSVSIELMDYISSGGLFILDAEALRPLFFIEPSLDIDQPLLRIASLLIGSERSPTGDSEWHDLRLRVAGKFRELRNERLSNADQETWSRYLLYQDKLFCFDNGVRRRWV